MHYSLFTGRRRFLAALAAAPLALSAVRAQAAAPVVSVTKLEGCGCCDSWAESLRKSGFSVTVRAVPDLGPVRRRNGIAKDFDTCHSALVEGYVIEGHVPAADIQRLLRSKLKVAGLVVPGMPSGSPGMEGQRSDPYEVLTFDRTGKTQVYARYR